MNLDTAGHPTWLAYLIEFVISLVALVVVGDPASPRP